jgi:hypothetical protein
MAGPALRMGVALLGARLAFSDLAQLGWEPIAFLVFAVGVTIFSGVLCAQLMGVGRKLGVLTGGSVAICGASAAMAISSVLPESEDRRRATLFTVIGVASLSTVAMIFYPLLGDILGMDDEAMGFFIGATIHDVAQVVGAGLQCVNRRRRSRSDGQAVSGRHVDTGGCRDRICIGWFSVTARFGESIAQSPAIPAGLSRIFWRQHSWRDTAASARTAIHNGLGAPVIGNYGVGH